MSQVTEHSHEVRVHIDQHAYTTPTPTTGHALYELGHIGEGRELFKEIQGDREDPPIPNDERELHLNEDEHFHTAEAREKPLHIIVNLERKEVEKRVLTFREVVAIAYPDPDFGPNVVWTVTFKKAVAPTHEGTLIEGGKVEIKNGTIFNVSKTTKS
jgi:hypothetical protein